MSLQKKNVILGFVKDDYVPSPDQLIVKYSSGKGNNLHEVDCIDGSSILVSMPKKYRHTVWLKKEDCLVIDPIEEGKKVKGEIVCLLPCDTVRDLVENKQWPTRNASQQTQDTSQKSLDELLHFFSSSSDKKRNGKDNDDHDDMFPSTDSSDDGETDEEHEETDDEEMEDDADEDETYNSITEKENSNEDSNKCSSVNGRIDVGNSHFSTNNIYQGDNNEAEKDRNTSKVQLVTSGIVTVTNVVSEGLENDMQSLEFGADDEDEDDCVGVSNDLQRHANTIRIQVNYKNEQTTQ